MCLSVKAQHKRKLSYETQTNTVITCTCAYGITSKPSHEQLLPAVVIVVAVHKVYQFICRFSLYWSLLCSSFSLSFCFFLSLLLSFSFLIYYFSFFFSFSFTLFACPFLILWASSQCMNRGKSNFPFHLTIANCLPTHIQRPHIFDSNMFSIQIQADPAFVPPHKKSCSTLQKHSYSWTQNILFGVDIGHTLLSHLLYEYSLVIDTWFEHVFLRTP